MKMDYRNIKNEYGLMPDDWYEAKVEDVKIDATKNDNEVWKLTLAIQDEGYFNRKVWDNIIFMDKLASRNKEVFRAFGYDVDNQELDIEPENLFNKNVKIKVFTEKYEKDGHEKSINKVEFFDGYKAINEDEDIIPF